MERTLNYDEGNYTYNYEQERVYVFDNKKYVFETFSKSPGEYGFEMIRKYEGKELTEEEKILMRKSALLLGYIVGMGSVTEVIFHNVTTSFMRKGEWLDATWKTWEIIRVERSLKEKLTKLDELWRQALPETTSPSGS